MTVREGPWRNATATPASVGSTLRAGRRVALLIGAVLMVVVCAGVFALIQAGRDANVEVLALARTVPAGQVLSTQDLRTVRVAADTSVPLVAAGQLSQVLGRSAAVPLVSGALLSTSQLGPRAWPPPGQAVLAVAVKAARLPSGVGAGAHVVVVTVAAATATQATTTPTPTSSQQVAATVLAVDLGVDGVGTSVVSLLLAQPDALTLASSANELALVVVAG